MFKCVTLCIPTLSWPLFLTVIFKSKLILLVAFTGNLPIEIGLIGAGLLLWNQTRQQWVGNKGSNKRPQVQEPRLRWLNFHYLLVTYY